VRRLRWLTWQSSWRGVAGAERSIDELSIGKQGIFAHCKCMSETLDVSAIAEQVGDVVNWIALLFLSEEDAAADDAAMRAC
jgi:hypothetical protein